MSYQERGDLSTLADDELPEQIVLRGRAFTRVELGTIRSLVTKHYDRGRTFISQAICQELQWKQPNGWLKDRACRDVLVRLESLGYVQLPPRKCYPNNRGLGACQQDDVSNPVFQLAETVTEYPQEIVLELSKGTDKESIWNGVVNRYHYLGHQVVVGRCLKYLVKADAKLVGAICFSSPAWNLAPRDRLLSQFLTPHQIHDLVINNSRFLILPQVQVPNLASTILSAACQQVVDDWSWYYAITPLFVETFVDANRFRGTCYRAANWIEIGSTQGFAKKGSSHHNSQQPKQIFLYALNKPMRRKLRTVCEQEGHTDE